MQLSRRDLFRNARSLAYAGAAAALLRPALAAETFEIMKSKEEWKKLLSPEQFAVLRDHSTERPFTSPLDKENRAGKFACAACELPLYDASSKYDSGTGWPSFFDHLPNAIGTSDDSSLLFTRIEVHCRRCGGHLGHVFEDGPKPTGKRYCMNGVAMKFIPADGSGA